MAQTFNLTAQINLRGPANIKPIVANIKKQLGSINTNVNIKLDSKAARNIDVVNNKLKALNATLIQASRNSQNLASSLASIGAAAQSLNSLNKVNSNLSKVINNVNSSSKALKQASSEMENFGRQSFLALKRFAAISVVTAGIYGLFRAITDGARAFVAFDKELIRLQQITKSSSVGIKDLENEIVRLSVSLGVNGESLTQVAVTLAQAGLTASQTKQALEALAKTELAPSFEDIKETTEGAIAAMRQFGISTAELEGALGSINAVAAAFAVESGDIIAAIQRAGGVFASASKGVSEGTDALNEFIAVFTSVRATTRESAETIATGLRTIFTRIQRGSTIKFLREFGIELQDSEGKFVGAYEAIRRLSEGLQSIDTRDIRFSQIVEELGGFRQISKVITLIQQFGDAQNALRVAQQGQGSLSEAQIKAQQSLANQLVRVRNEFLALIKSIGQTQTFQSLFKMVLGLTSSLIKLTSVFKPLLPLLTVLGAIKGGGAIAKFGKGFFGSFKKGGGSSAAGSTLGQTVTGSSPSTTASPLDAAALNALTQAVTANSGALNSSTTALNSLMTPLSALTTSVSGLNTSFGLVVTPLSVLDASVNNLDNSIKSLIVKIDNIGGGGTTLNGGGKVLAFARGGVVPGSGNRDTVPAMLQPGEFVIRKKAVETIGSQNLHSMNKYGSGGSVISGSSGQQRQKFADGGLAQLARLSPGMQGKTNIPTAIKRENLLQNEDVISNKIIRTRLTKQDIKKTAGNTQQFKNTIEKIRSDEYKNQNYESGLGFSFENWVFDNLKTIGLSGKYERAKTNNYPVDLIPTGNAAPVEIKYKTDSEPDPFILNKHFRYLLDTDKWKSSSFTPEINSSPPVDIGTIRVLELADGVKDDIYYPKGVSQETKLRRKEKADKRISPFYEPQTFLDGGWVERMQQQKKSSLVNAATQLEYWIDKIYAGTEEVGFSPSFKGGKNPSEQVDFKELQDRLGAISNFLTAPASPAKAKRSGLKSAGGYEPEEMLDAIKLYQGGSGPLTRAMANNDLLFVDRDEQYDTEEVTNRLQAAAQYKTRKKLYSGLGKSQFKETLKDTGLSEDDILDQNKVKAMVGKTIDFPTFLSTSYQRDVASAFVGDPGAMMEISTAKAKTSGIDINKAKMTADTGKKTSRRLPGIDKISEAKLFQYDDEDEFILPPNTAFKVKKASTNKIRATSDSGEEFDLVMGMGGDGQTPLMDLAVQMLGAGGRAKPQKFAVGGEAQSVADKFGLGKPLTADSWWTGDFAGQEILFDWSAPTKAYNTSDGSRIDIESNLRQPLMNRSQREWMAFVDQQTKEREANKKPLTPEEIANLRQYDLSDEQIAKISASAQAKKAQAYVDRTSGLRRDVEDYGQRKKRTSEEYLKRARGYMAGGVAEETGISPNLQQLLDRIAAVGGPKTATELAGYPSGSMSIRKVLNKNSLLTGKNIPQAEAIVAKAEEAYRTKQNAKQSAIDAANEFALVGAYPLGYSKDYGPEDIGGLSTFFTARGLPFKYQQEIDEIAADVRDLPSRAAEKIQMKDIFGTGTRLAFDLDDTLITDADIFKPGSSADPDIPAYSDVSRVTEALKQAKLTRLGEVLRSKLTETPQLLEDIRILTARPQNNAEAVSARLTQLGLAISADKISGVSGATNKVDNLSELETLIDDRLATIEQVNKAGKSAIHYEPIKGYDPSSASGTKAAQVVEGYAIEGLMERLGVPIVEDDANRAIDYPDGLGSKARIWGVKSNVPTDVKRTMDGDAFGRFRGEIERYYSENVQALASGGPVKLYHGSNSGPDDSILNSFKEKGILSNIASGYGQGSGFFMWSDKNSAVKHAKNLVDPNSNMTTSATTGGRPMVVEATETLDPKNWDLDYELQNKDIIDYIHANFDSLKPLLDKSQGVNLGDGLKNFQFRNKIDEYTDPNDNTTMRKVQIGFNDNDKEVRRTLANTTGDLRTGQVVGKLVEALRMGDPDVLDAFESDFFSNLQPGTALKYVGSSPLMPSNIETFALGGRAGLSTADTVPALLTPGEFVINKKAATTIGYGKLNKLNKADKLKGYNKGGIVGGIQRFNDGGDVVNSREWANALKEISTVFQSTGNLMQSFNQVASNADAAGNTEIAERLREILNATSGSDRTTLLAGGPGKNADIFMDEFDLGRVPEAFDALAAAIERNINVQELFASSAEEAGVSVQKFTKDVKSQILDKSLANINNRKQSRSSLRTEFARARLLDFSDPAKVDKQREALKTSLGSLISDPAQLNKAVNDLITGAQNGSVSLQDIAASSAEVAFALNSSIDRQEALNAATTELEDTLGGLTDAARATVDELESFEYGKSGQATKDFGFLGGLNPGAALQFKNSAQGSKLLQTAQKFQNLGFDGLEEQLSKLPGPVGDAVKAIGGLPGVLATVSSVIGSEILPQLSKALGMGDSEIMAGVGGALAEGGSMAISMGTLGQQLAGPIGGMIGTIGGAVAGAIKGFVTGFETKALENALKRLGEQTEKISEAFANLAKNATQDNLNIVRKENQGLVTNIQELQELGEISDASRAADATVYGTLAGLGTLLAGAGLFAAGAGLSAVGAGATATGVGAPAGIPAIAAGTGMMSIGTGLMYASPAAAAAGAAYGGFMQDYSDLDNEAYKASLDAAQSYIDGLTKLAERKISFLSVEALDQDVSDYEDFTKQLNERIKRGEITPANAEIERANFNAEFGRTRSVAIQEAQRSALLRSGFNIEENQSINDFTQNNAAASSVAQQAANDAFIQLARAEINRQFGSNTEAARRKEKDLGSEGLLRRGQEIAGINDYQAKAAQRLANISKELSIETEKLYEAYNRALAGIRRFTDGIDELIKSSDQSAGFLTGQAQIGPVDRTNENMLSNMSAYSAAELEPVIESVVNASGGTAEAQKLGDAIRANQVISQQLPDLLRDAETGDISGVTSQLEEALRGANISDEIAAALSREIGTELESRTGDRVGGPSFDEILQNFPAFQQALQSTQKAQEVGVAVLKAQNDALDKVNQQANKFAEQLRKSAEWLRTADTIRLEGALNLQRALGQIPTLDQLNEPFETEIRSLSGINSSDPVLIANSIRANNEAQKEARKRQKTALANNNKAGTDEATADLARLTNASNDAYQALEKLATTGAEAANILTKIEEERQLGRNTIDFVRKISTQSGEEAVEMQRSFDAFNRTLDGTLNFGNVRERRLAYQGMDTILPLLRGSEAGRQAEADFTINMLRGQGVNVDQEFGNTGSSIKDLVLAGTTGTDANTTALIKKYDESIAKQEEAARQLAYLNEEAAYLETLPTIAIILDDLNQRLPAIIAAALQQGNPGQPRDPMQGVPAPMPLDVAVQEGQGFMDAQRARRAAELQAREAEAAAEAERRAAAPAVPRPAVAAPAGAAVAPAGAAAAPAGAAAVVNPAIFDRLAATLPQIDMQMLNVVNSMTALSNGVIKLDATIALLQTELARDNGFAQSVTNFTETTRTFGGHVDTFTRKIDTFGTYVDKLDKAVGSLSNATITMGGNYTVDVRVSGAAAFTAIEDKTKDLINKEIDLAMGEMVAKINRATGFNLDLNRRT